jgi:hypothetical protein
LTRNFNGSRGVRDLHFPTNVDVPNRPILREVHAGSYAASKRAEQEAKEIIEGSYIKQMEAGLKALGQSFHPLQDSWSHAGGSERAIVYIRVFDHM